MLDHLRNGKNAPLIVPIKKDTYTPQNKTRKVQSLLLLGSIMGIGENW